MNITGSIRDEAHALPGTGTVRGGGGSDAQRPELQLTGYLQDPSPLVKVAPTLSPWGTHPCSVKEGEELEEGIQAGPAEAGPVRLGDHSAGPTHLAQGPQAFPGGGHPSQVLTETGEGVIRQDSIGGKVALRNSEMRG